MTLAPSDLSDATAELAEARRRTAALAVFSRSTAHDLSNFLTVIRTYSELLLADLPPEHQNRADLEEIALAADATVAYVQRITAFARVESAKRTSFALDALVTGSFNQPDTTALGHVHVTTQSGATLLGPATALTDALHELVANARAAAPKESVVSVRTRLETVDADRVQDGVPLAAGHWAVVEVIDQGPGLPEAIAQKACEPFVTGQTGVRGAGFGLSLARCAAWACNGVFTIGRAGNSTVARLYLPPTTAA